MGSSQALHETEALKLVLISGVRAHSLGVMVGGVGFRDRGLHCMQQKQVLISNLRVYVAGFLWLRVSYLGLRDRGLGGAPFKEVKGLFERRSKWAMVHSALIILGAI